MIFPSALDGQIVAFVGGEHYVLNPLDIELFYSGRGDSNARREPFVCFGIGNALPCAARLGRGERFSLSLLIGDIDTPELALFIP